MKLSSKLRRKLITPAVNLAPAPTRGPKAPGLPRSSRPRTRSVPLTQDANLSVPARRTRRDQAVPEMEAPERGWNGASQASPLQLYLREIGKVDLLTPKEEIALGNRIKKGDEQAREQMIKANLRLVVKIARDYENLGLPLLDLINEGNMGLMKGVERFDPNKGAKLSTYASWWIKQSIKRALANQAKIIRLPVHVVDKVADIRRAELSLKEVMDRDPTDEELAPKVGLKPQQVRIYREAARAPVSLEAPLGNEHDSEPIAEVVADARAEAPFERLLRDSDSALMKEVFATLSPREQDILTKRFGLVDDTPRTLEEIGQRYGLTRERIRQIESQALKKLRTKMARRDRMQPDVPISLAE